MSDPTRISPLADTRQAERRRFLQFAGGAVVAGGALALASCGGSDNDSTTPSPTPTPTSTSTTGVTEADVLNFALQLEYWQANFYAYAVTGQPLSDDLLAGTGARGTIAGGGPVPFTDPVVAAYAREIAADKRAQVAFLRSVLGTATLAAPALDLTAAGAFTALARTAGMTGSSETFDPYASDQAFLLGAFVFADVAVTAYKGAISLFIATDANVEATAGLLATAAHHAAMIRTELYRTGADVTLLRTNAQRLSDARDKLDGARLIGGVDSLDGDQGVTGSDAAVANIVPADATGLVFSRSTGQVLNIAYLTAAAATSGGFFPAGVNGIVKSSAASG